jgi:hypothetical protein
MLACDVRNLGPMVLMWKKGHRVLTAGSVVVKRDKRIELNGTNVKISGRFSISIQRSLLFSLHV